MSNGTAPRVISYALERLFVDQDRDWVNETIAPVLAWVPGRTKKRRQQPFRFATEHIQNKVKTSVVIDLSWDEAELEQLVPGVRDHARRLREGRSAQREHVTELAAYGLTFVAISTLLPGRRVVWMQMGVAPDILFDMTPAALRGVETAGRATGGQGALKTVRNGTPVTKGKAAKPGKAVTLAARTDVAEVHLSLWCASPRISIMEQLRP
ncbi:MAG: hypothetical protein HYZ29_34465 [Myxococcales bacterium]|nr:hypothetical protein [Myxococcales bacterium]